MTRSNDGRRRALLLAVFVLLGPAAARAGGGVDVDDIPAPAAAPAPVAPIAVSSGAGGDAGCPPFEARYRAIPPRPPLSAAALLTRASP